MYTKSGRDVISNVTNILYEWDYLHHIIPQSSFGIVFDNFDFKV